MRSRPGGQYYRLLAGARLVWKDERWASDGLLQVRRMDAAVDEDGPVDGRMICGRVDGRLHRLATVQMAR